VYTSLSAIGNKEMIGKQIFKNILSGAVYLTLMFAASNSFANGAAPNPLCVLADDFGDLLKTRVTVKATGEGEVQNGNFVQTAPSGWVDSKIDVEQGKSLQIRSSGLVNLCSVTPYAMTFTLPAKTEKPVTSYEWTSSGIYIKKGWKYSIEVSGKYSKSASAAYLDSGKGLFAYIGDPSTVSDWSKLDHTPVYPQDPAYGTKNPNFYELYNYTTTDNALKSGYAFDPSKFPTGVSPETLAAQPEGLLYFRYADGNTGNGYDTNWAGDSSDNRDGYTVKVTYTMDCAGTNGQFLVGYIGDSDPKTAIADIANPNAGGKIINLNKYAHSDLSKDGNNTNKERLAGAYNEVAPATGRLWLKVLDKGALNYWGDGLYHGDGSYIPMELTNGSNSGEYKVDIVTISPPKKGFSTLVNNIIDPIRKFIKGDGVTPGLTERMYKGVTGNIDFIAGVRAAMAMSIIFFAFTYMLGLSNITQQELFILVVKMSIVITLIGPTSWEFFYKYLFSFFLEGTDDLIRIMSSQFATVLDGAQMTGPSVSGTAGQTTDLAVSTGNQQADTFAFLNQTLERFFTKETNIKILGLMSGFPIGFIMAILIYVAMGFFIFAIMKALLLYLIAIIMTALLLFIAPIFIIFIMFEKTKGMFDKWIKQLMSFALQPILLFTVLAIFNVFIFSAMYTILSFSVCWQCLAEIDLPISEKIFHNVFGNFDKFCIFSGYTPWGMDGGQEIAVKLAKTPVGLFMILIFFILCNAMLSFMDWIVEVAGTLTAGINAISLNKPVAQAISGAADTAKASSKMAFGAAKTTATKIDAASGHRISDKAKTTTRGVLDKMGLRSRTANILLGGNSLRGGSDGAGGKHKWSPGLMTHSEKKSAERQSAFLGKMKPEDRANFIKARQDERMAAKTGGADAKATYKAQEEKRNNMMGDGSKNAKFLMKAEAESLKTGGTTARANLLAGTSQQNLTDSRKILKDEKKADDKNPQFKIEYKRDKNDSITKTTVTRVKPDNPYSSSMGKATQNEKDQAQKDARRDLFRTEMEKEKLNAPTRPDSASGKPNVDNAVPKDTAPRKTDAKPLPTPPIPKPTDTNKKPDGSGDNN
jgi:type IV secretory pathway VirB6-like protein